MLLFLVGIGIIMFGGFLSLFSGKSRFGSFAGAAGAVAGSLVSVLPAFGVLSSGNTLDFKAAWNIPMGNFHVQIDPLSALFLIPVFLISSLSAIYGAGYLDHYRSKKNTGPAWFFYNLLLAAMAVVITARNGMLFLLAWEVMSLAPFFLITFDDEKEKSRQAGWIYLVATHIGMAFLLVFFIVLSGMGDNMDFDQFAKVQGTEANILFLLAILGFGAKAGFVPLHVWLPEAHPAAPSHASAVMSAVMIKTGIYGFLRALTFLGHPPLWWAWLIIGIGAVSGLFGILFALAQHELKRLLAYSSVENMGIITMGIGIGVSGISTGSPVYAVFGFAGSLFHMINHAVFKSLLFLGAGAVLHRSGTLEIDRLGGVIRKMPVTALCFLTGAAAICGLPPLNGFASEFMIYMGVFKGTVGKGMMNMILILCITGGLALIGGLSVACFTKAFGMVFLGNARSEAPLSASEVNPFMRVPMMILAAGCILMGIFSPAIIRILHPVIKMITSLPGESIEAVLGTGSGLMNRVIIASVIFLVMLFLAVCVRRWLLSGREVTRQGTWDCGYALPTPKMQYTASSYAQNATDFFSFFLRTRHKVIRPKGFFPEQCLLESETPDTGTSYLFGPLVNFITSGLARFQWIQHGKLQLYVLYIAVTLMILLIWKAW